ncbi:MAG TPA: MBL fold metallo-hydrolase [Cyclobacteriaceae bacterium]
MKRREMIKSAGMASLALITTKSPANTSKTNTLKLTTSGHFEFTVGQLKLLVVTDGHSLFKPIQPIFAPGISGQEVNALLQEYYQPTDGIDLALNVLVIKKDKQVILIDTGCGVNFGPQSGKLSDNLRTAGIDPAAVTDIILTHAHPDHLGGMLNSEGLSVFPNATVFISRLEYDFWTSPNPDFSKSKSDKAFAGSMVNLATRTLKTYQSRMRYYQEGDILFDCIRMKLSAGHTPGHSLLHIFSGKEELMHIADTVHTHVLLMAHPEWGQVFDTNFDQAIDARKKVLEQIATSRSRIFSYHLPWPGLGHVRKKQMGYEWVQENFSTPQLYQES